MIIYFKKLTHDNQIKQSKTRDSINLNRLLNGMLFFIENISESLARSRMDQFLCVGRKNSDRVMANLDLTDLI